MNGRLGVLACLCGLVGLVAGCEDGPHVAIRAENLTVTPSTGPVTHVVVRNLRHSTYQGAIIAEFPNGWKLNRSAQPVRIKPRQTVRVPFAIERGRDAADNAYTVRLKAVGSGPDVARTQRIVCASAPYFKPVIDGKHDDWADAIPATFTTAGKKTTISTYWTRRTFSLLVAVEEDEFKPNTWSAWGPPSAADAVQIALSPRDARTPTSSWGTAQRYEFVLMSTGDRAWCYLLLRRGERLSAMNRHFPGPTVRGATVTVTRSGGVTYYECSIPFEAMGDIRPDPGREFCFSLLVHDPDGTGLRDWGEAAGLWPSQRNRLAWCRWKPAKWPKDPPFDNKIEWGFCSSKH